MDEPRDHTFREQWWKQIHDDSDVVEGLLAAASVISHQARKDGTRALISRRRLAEILGVSEATATRRTQKLVKLGYLEVVERGRRRGDGTVTANVYELSQRLTQVSPWESGNFPADGASTAQTEASTAQDSVSTAHPGDKPLSLPSLIPPIVKRTTADAAALRRNHGANDWRAKDRDLFRSVIGTDEVTHDDKSISVDAFYEALRERLDWPGKYLDESTAAASVALIRISRASA